MSDRTPDQRDEWKADAEDNRLAELYGDEAPVDEPEEFSESIGDVPGPVLLEILVSLGATDIEHTDSWLGFAIDAERYCIEAGQLWAASMEMASLLSEKIRRAARAHEEALAMTGA